MDKDLASIQEARDLVTAAHETWQGAAGQSRSRWQRVFAAMAEAGYQALTPWSDGTGRDRLRCCPAQETQE